jgi:hypothetical protein
MDEAREIGVLFFTWRARYGYYVLDDLAINITHPEVIFSYTDTFGLPTIFEDIMKPCNSN